DLIDWARSKLPTTILALIGTDRVVLHEAEPEHLHRLTKKARDQVTVRVAPEEVIRGEVVLPTRGSFLHDPICISVSATRDPARSGAMRAPVDVHRLRRLRRVDRPLRASDNERPTLRDRRRTLAMARWR